MDEVAEQQEIANEISDAISNPIGFGQDVDEVILFAFKRNKNFGIFFSCTTLSGSFIRHAISVATFLPNNWLILKIM